MNNKAAIDYIKENGSGTTSTYKTAGGQDIIGFFADKCDGINVLAVGEDQVICEQLLPAAVDVVLETGQASVSMLQRRLKLGYSRAARLVDQMEERGIVGPFEGSKPRQLLITRAQWDEMQMGGAPAVEDAPPFDTGDE